MKYQALARELLWTGIVIQPLIYQLGIGESGRPEEVSKVSLAAVSHSSKKTDKDTHYFSELHWSCNPFLYPFLAFVVLPKEL